MTFFVRFHGGYEVCVVLPSLETGYLHTYPLRNFGERQGDAICFKMFDCPLLTDMQVRSLINSYDPSKKYRRINRTTFRLQ